MKTSLGIGIGTNFGNSNPLVTEKIIDIPLTKDLIPIKQGGITDWTFSRTTTATYKDVNGIIRYASINQPRFEGGGISLTAGNDGTCFGGVSIEDDAMKFDGVDSRVQAQDTTLTLNDEVVIIGRIKINVTGSVQQIINHTYDSNSRGWQLTLSSSGNLEFLWRDITNTNWVSFNHSVSSFNGGYVDFAVKHKFGTSTNAAIFINSVKNPKTANISLVRVGSSNRLTIGALPSNSERFNSSVKYIRVYDGLLSDEQIISGERITDGLVAEYTGEHYEGLPNSPIKITDTTKADLSKEYDGQYLAEEQRTNLFINSATPATRTIAISNATTYTIWCEGTGSITLSGGGSGVATQDNPVTFVSTSTSVTATISGDLVIVQLEQGTAPTSYIPTTSSAVTRTKDELTYSGDFDDVKSIVYEVTRPIIDINKFAKTLTLNVNGDTGNQLEFITRHTTFNTKAQLHFSGNLAFVIENADTMKIDGSKMGFSYNAVEASYYLDGNKVGQRSSFTMPTGFNQLHIAPINNARVTIKNIKLYKKPLSKATMERLTK